MGFDVTVSSISDIIAIAQSRNGMLPDCDGANILRSIVNIPVFSDAIEEYANRMNSRAFYTLFATMSDVLPDWAKDRLISEAPRFKAAVRLLCEHNAIVDQYSSDKLRQIHYDPSAINNKDD